MLALLAVSGCYAPHPQPGAPCGDGQCPAGLVCSVATNTCERHAVDAALASVDATIDAARLDGSPDALTGAMLVQQMTNHAATGDALSVTLATPTSGHVLVVIGAAPAGPLTSVTGGGATWTNAAASYINSNTEIWVGVSDGSSSVVTVHRTGNTGEIWLAVSEWSGLDTTSLVDAGAHNAGTTGPVSAGSIATTRASDLVLFAASAFAQNPFGTPSPGTWTAMATINTAQVTQAAWFRVEPTTATLAPQATITAGDWDAAIVALRVAP